MASGADGYVNDPDGDFVPFWPTGAHVKGEYHCSGCGYGVAVFRKLPRCPMCGGETWEQATWSPFARAADRALGLERRP